MAVSKLITMCCDRCGKRQAITRDNLAYAWARIEAAEANGARSIMKRGTNADICPQCMHELLIWWSLPSNGGAR